MAVSLLLKSFLSFQDVVINSDGVVYLEAARMIAEGHYSQSLLLYPMPAYPLLIAVVHLIVPDWILAAKLISLIAAALITVPVYWITACLFDRRAAFYAALAVALLPSLNDLAPDVIRDPCFLLFACGSVYWMTKAYTAQQISGILLGFIMAGIALLFRIEAISLFMVYILYPVGIVLFIPAQRRFAGKALLYIIIPALFGMVGLFAVGTTVEGNARIDQLWTFTLNILSGRFLVRYHEIYSQLKASERLSPMPSGELFKLARHYMPLLYFIGMVEAFFKALFVPYAAALWFARRSLSTKGLSLLVMAVVFHSLIVLLYFLHIDYLSTRYILFCALLVMPIVGRGVVVMEDFCQSLKWRKVWVTVMGMVLLLLPLYRSVGQGFGEDRAIADAGKWLSSEPQFRQMQWAVNDLRYYLYAGKPFDYLKERNQALAFIRLRTAKDYAGMEDLAREKGKDLIIMRSSQREPGEENRFRTFHLLKRIESPHSIVTIYASPNTQKDASMPSEGSAK